MDAHATYYLDRLHRADVALAILLTVTTVDVLLVATRPKAWDLAGSAVSLISVAAWAALDGPLEGQTVLRLAPTHGLTTGDLTALPALLLAAVLAGRWLARRRDRP